MPRRSSPLVQVAVFGGALLCLLLAAATERAARAEADRAIVIVDEPLHLGDGRVRRFESAWPEEESASWTFEVPRASERWVILCEARGLAVPGDDGEGRAVVRIDGREVGILNEEVRRETPSHSHRVSLEVGRSLEPGEHEIAILPGTERNGTVDDFEIVSLRLLPAQTVRVRVVDGEGRGLWAKVVVEGRGVETPSFGPYGNDDEIPGVTVLGPEGLEMVLPHGTYDVHAVAGPEREVAGRRIVSRVGVEREVVLRMPRAIDTGGWLAGDFHVHSGRSHDSDVPLPERVASCLAGGLEVVAATDHNVVTDYGPTIRELGASDRILSIVGDEITTHRPGFGHFNAFPLRADAEAVPSEGQTPAELFRSARRAAPDGVENLIQVNHPRTYHSGYFYVYELDGTSSDRDGWSGDFDAIEVLNGMGSWDRMAWVLEDWYGFLDAGRRVTATGNSDSHRALHHDAGFPCTFVQVGTDDPGEATTADVVEALRAGRAVVTSGPFVTIEGPGGAGPGDEVEAPDGHVAVRVRVQAPSWIEVDRVELLGPGAEVLWSTEIGPVGPGVRFDGEVEVELPDGGWLVAAARGTAYRADVLADDDRRPFGFTNPLWVRAVPDR